MNIVSVAAILGMILGTAGFVMSLMNYLRDQARVRVILLWDMTDTHTLEKFGFVRVTNIGRRPVFISCVALELPKGFGHSGLMLMNTIGGKRLAEGEELLNEPINYDSIAKYSSGWKRIRAYAIDSTGKKYYSDFPNDKATAPSWVVT